MVRVTRNVWKRAGIALAAVIALGVVFNGAILGDGSENKGSKPSVTNGQVTSDGRVEPSGETPKESQSTAVTNPMPNPGSDQPAAGEGRVRTGTAQEGCFQDKFEYIEAWNRTGVEPEPCFVAPPPNNQDQPNDVKRTQDGKPF
jgi:hypothetical protein